MTCDGCKELIVPNMPGTMLCNRCAYPERYQTGADKIFREDRQRKQKDAKVST